MCRPPLQDDNVKKEAPATTATACAAVCEPSKSEPDGKGLVTLTLHV